MYVDSLTQDNIQRFVTAWYQALDVHAPVEECYRFLSDEALDMKFPDGDIRDFGSFKSWYDRVTNHYFDENHTVLSVQSTIGVDEAVVDVVVGWQASWFEAPAPKSKRTSMNATQEWRVRRSKKNAHGLEITFYNATAKPFEYAPGFARLG